MCKNMTQKDLIEFMAVNEMHEQYSLISSAVEYAATIPLHTVDCERGFSSLNLMKTKIRNTFT